MDKINYYIRLTERKQILMEPDKTYVLKIIKYLWSIKQVIGNTLYYCFNFDKKQITNPFRNTKENDIRNTINWIDKMDTKHLQLKLELSFKIDLIDDYRSTNTNFHISCFLSIPNG